MRPGIPAGLLIPWQKGFAWISPLVEDVPMSKQDQHGRPGDLLALPLIQVTGDALVRVQSGVSGDSPRRPLVAPDLRSGGPLRELTRPQAHSCVSEVWVLNRD